MFSTTAMVHVATSAFRTVGTSISALLEFEYQQNLCRIFIKMFQTGRIALALNARPYFLVKNDVEASFETTHLSVSSKARFLTTSHDQQQFSHSPISLRGSDARTSVALCPTALQITLGHEYKFASAPCSTPTHGATRSAESTDATIDGAIEVLNVLVSVLSEDWRDAPRMAEPTKSNLAPPMARSYATRGTSVAFDLTTLRHKETFETSEHNKDRLRATLARTRSIYTPGSCVRPSSQQPGSASPTVLHGSDGSLNVALYPKAMLVKLAAYEGDDMVDSGVCDPGEVVCGAIERLNALVNGIGYSWADKDKDATSRACHMQRVGSMESVCSILTESTGSHPITPLDRVAFSRMVSC